MLRDYLRHAVRFSPAARAFLFGEFLSGIGQGVLLVLRNLYLGEWNYSETFIGQLLAMGSVGSLLFTLPVSRLMDRGSIKPFLILGALAVAAGLAGTALWPTPLPLFISTFAIGAGTSMLSVGNVPFYMRNCKPEERPYLFGVGTALGPAAGLAGAILVFGLSKLWGEGIDAQRHVLLVASGFCLASTFVFLFLHEGKPPEVAVKREFDFKLALRLVGPATIIGLGAGITIPFINLYFKQRFNQGPAAVSAIFSAAQVVVFFAFLAAPILGRRFGGVRTVNTCQMLSIPFFLIMAFSMSPVLAVIGFLGRHALMNMANPVMSQFTMEVVPTNHQAQTNGFREMSWTGSWLFGTMLGGWLIEHARFIHDGFTVCMLVTIALYLVGSLLFYSMWKDSPAMPPKTG